MTFNATQDNVVVDRGAVGSGLLLATDFPGPEDADHLLAFNARGTRLAVGCDQASHVFAFDLRSGREVARLADLPHLTSMGFLSAEVLLVAQQSHMQGGAFRPGRCLRFDLRRGGRELVWEEEGLRSVAVSPTGRVLAFGVSNGLALYDTLKKQVLHRGESEVCRRPEHSAFSTGGRYAAVGLCGSAAHTSPRLVIVWDAEEGRRHRTFEIRADCLSALAFRGDTLGLAAAAWRDVYLFEPDRGEDPAVTCRFEKRVSALQFRGGGGRTLAVLLEDGGLVLLRARTGQVEHRVPPPAGRAVGYARPSADWSWFAGAAEGRVVVWPAPRRRPERRS
jgi:hypothetical protein